MDYKAYLKELNAKIKLNPNVYTSRIAVRPVINNNIKKVKFSFPIDLKEQIENGSRMKFSFSYNQLEVYIFGFNSMLFVEEMDTETRRMISQYPFLDKNFLNKPNVFVFSQLGHLHYVLLEIVDTTYNLWLMLPNGDRFNMNTSIEEYIEFLLLTRGMYLGEAYLCPDFPKELLTNKYDGFYENMELLFNITPDQLPMCYHKDVVKNAIPVFNKYGKSLHNEFRKLFESEISEGKCTLSPSLDEDYQRISPPWFAYAIELNLGISLPKSYRQLFYDFGYDTLRFTRTVKDNQLITIQFIKPLDVFRDNKTNDFNYDANVFLYGEKGKVPAFNGIRLFAISGEYKFGMHIIEEDTIEIVMVDSVENMRLVQMPEHIRTMDGFINRFLETKGEFLLNEIPL